MDAVFPRVYKQQVVTKVVAGRKARAKMQQTCSNMWEASIRIEQKTAKQRKPSDKETWHLVALKTETEESQ